MNLLSLLGKDKLNNGELVLGPVEKAEWFRFPYQPPEEYDFETTFTRSFEKGILQDFIDILPIGDRFYQWVMRRKREGEVGVGFFRADKTPWVQEWLPPISALKRKFTVRIQLRKEGVTCFVNGKMLVKTSGLSELFGPAAEKRPVAFLLGTGPNRVVVHSAEVREITGKGKIVKVEPQE